MKEITIDCRGFVPRSDLHNAFAKALSFPDWYGNNLDALYDMLTDIRQETTLILLHFDREDPKNRGFLQVLEDSHRNNPCLNIIFE